MRCGQPLVGPLDRRCKEDERLLQTVMDANAQSHKLLIFDARQSSVADTNKVPGSKVIRVTHTFIRLVNAFSGPSFLLLCTRTRRVCGRVRRVSRSVRVVAASTPASDPTECSSSSLMAGIHFD